MHTLARRYVQTGIGFLGIGLILGIYMLIRREIGGTWPHPYLVSAHTHAVFLGFVMFMILGVALWIFPRPAKDDNRWNMRSRIRPVGSQAREAKGERF